MPQHERDLQADSINRCALSALVVSSLSWVWFCPELLCPLVKLFNPLAVIFKPLPILKIPVDLEAQFPLKMMGSGTQFSALVPWCTHL